jgi:uncharacterized protein (TIGR03437 family)
MDFGRRSYRVIFGCLLAMVAVPAAFADLSGAAGAPAYTALGIVHAATQLQQNLAPNTIATLYGANLSFTTRAANAGDLSAGTLPTSLEGVTVYVNNMQANLFFVSPGQINFLIPSTITTPTATVVVVRQATGGPVVTIPMASSTPGFFEWNGNQVVAVHLDGTVITPSAPAAGGEIILLFAAGLGQTTPPIISGEVVHGVTWITALAQFRILLNGDALPLSNVLYAGLAPNFSGLYQINLQLPAVLPSNPQIQIAMGAEVSPVTVRLSTQ